LNRSDVALPDQVKESFFLAERVCGQARQDGQDKWGEQSRSTFHGIFFADDSVYPGSHNVWNGLAGKMRYDRSGDPPSGRLLQIADRRTPGYYSASPVL
jgi:hypothetical protein